MCSITCDQTELNHVMILHFTNVAATFLYVYAMVMHLSLSTPTNNRIGNSQQPLPCFAMTSLVLTIVEVMA